jgi:hypothetical protein
MLEGPDLSPSGVHTTSASICLGSDGQWRLMRFSTAALSPGGHSSRNTPGHGCLEAERGERVGGKEQGTASHFVFFWKRMLGCINDS